MRIGEFAKTCNTKISVLRHYDKLGLLKPVYIDRFTEYRYYDKSQTAVFERIGELKKAGFSLSEIKRMLYFPEEADDLFSEKKAELEAMLRTLETLRENFQGGITMEQTFKPLVENVNIPFENDEQVVGKWQVLDKCGNGDNYPTLLLGDGNGLFYFLPNGEFYWCFGWTKGKLIFNNGESIFANDYRVEQRGDDLYMVVDFKSADFSESGETTAIALRKLDSKHYTKEEIARKDDINKPFVNDERVLGKWKAFCYFDPIDISDKADFVPYENPPKGSCHYTNLYFKEIEFSEGGHCSSVYSDELISGDDMQVWTKGCVLRKWNSCACAYEIKAFDGKEYLFIEWKSGDYRWGGRDTSHYVMVRA